MYYYHEELFALGSNPIPIRYFSIDYNKVRFQFEPKKNAN